jgi:putative ABC transport system permease protein
MFQMKNGKINPPGLARRILLFFLRDELVEEVLGDLDEQFYLTLQHSSPLKARLDYYYQVFNYFRAFAVRKPCVRINPAAMIDMNFKISRRYLLKDKVFTSINIAGLAMGMATALVMLLWIQHELNFEQFHEKKDRIYQVYGRGEIDGTVRTTSNTPHVLAPVLEVNYPEFEKIVRTNWVGAFVLHSEKKHLEAKGFLTDPAFLEVFSFPLLQGNPTTALASPRSIVLTETMAMKLFGDEDALNRIVRIDSISLFTVTAIVKDLPDNTQFTFDYLVPWSYTREVGWDETAWDQFTIQTYALLKEGVKAETVDKHIANVLAVHKPELKQMKAQTFLHPMSKWHLWSYFENGKIVGGVIDHVRKYGLIAGIILLIACINYMNLSTARSVKRAREIGICKIVGAPKTSIVMRFLGESILLSFLAAAIAILIVQIILPWFNSVNYTNLSIPYLEYNFWMYTSAFILFTGVLAGSYPAVYLSSYKAINAIKGVFRFSHSAVAPRKMLVIAQFGFAIFMISCTLVIYQQMKHAQTRDIGFLKDNLVFTYLKGDIRKNYVPLKNELLASGSVTSVMRTNSPVIDAWNRDAYDWDGKNPGVRFEAVKFHTDGDFTQTIGAKIITGRDINIYMYPGDSTAVLINETAMRMMGFENPIGQQIQSQEGRWQVVGVVEDFLAGAALSNQQAIVVQGPGRHHWFGTMTFRLDSNQSVSANLETIEKIFKKYDPEYPFVCHFAADELDYQFGYIKRLGTLASASSGLAIFISCLGLFALAAYMIEGRFKEIGIRKVLGASVFSISILLSRDFLKLVLISIFIASPVAWWSMNSWLANFPYRIELHWTWFAITGIAALIISVVTISYQSMRAALSNPVDGLKSE